MKKSDCENIQNKIPLYIDNMLSEEESDTVCEHIASCEACRAELHFMQSVLKKTEQLPETEISAGFHSRLMEKVRSDAASPKAGFAVPWKKAVSLAAAAAVVALSVVSFLSIDKNGGNENPDVYLSTPAPGVENMPTADKSDETAASTNQEPLAPSDAAADNKAPASGEPVATEKGAISSESASPLQAAPNTEAPVASAEAAPKATPSPAASTEAAPRAASEPAAYAGIAEDNSAPLTDGDAEEGAANAPAAAYARGAAGAPIAFHAEEAEAEEAAADTAATSGGAGGSSSGGVSRSLAQYSIVTVTVSENARAQAAEILSAFEKDSNGYLVGEKLYTVLNKLAALEGYSTSTKTADGLSGNYIVWK